jgi:signal peptidase II
MTMTERGDGDRDGAGGRSGAVKPVKVRARRAGVFAGAAGVVLAALTLKTWAERALVNDVMDLGPLDLRLIYNPGAAFSLGADHPGLVLALTSGLSLAVAVLAWRAAATPRPIGQLAGLSLLLGGAVTNVVDRAGDAVVTDYFHTGWWPTFNLPDVTIIAGALLLVITEWRRPAAKAAAPDDLR